MLVSILSRVLQYDKDIQERESYIADLEMENFENDFHHAINNTRISDSGLLSGYLYIDIDDTQEHPIIKLVSVITCHKRKFNNEDANTSILTYKNSGHIIFLND